MVANAAGRSAGEVLLVDVPVGGDGWADDLPPCPPAVTVTALFSDVDAEAIHGEAVSRLGYHVAGVLGRPDAPGIQLAVPRSAAQAHPRWWTELGTLAVQVWDTALGPVARVTTPALRAHGIDPPA